MNKLQTFREQNPAYKDVPDEKLAPALHRKFYSKLPEAEFYAKIGFSPKAAEPVESFPGEADQLATFGDSTRNANAALAREQAERVGRVTGEVQTQTSVPSDKESLLPGGQSRRGVSTVQKIAAERLLTEADAARERTVPEVVADSATAFGGGVAQIPGSVVGLVAPDSQTAKDFKAVSTNAHKALSKPLQARLELATERIQRAAEAGLWDEVKTAMGEYFVESPELAAHFAIKTLPSMAGVLGPAKAAQLVAMMRGASPGTIAKVTGETAGVANAIMNGGGARQEAYDEIYKHLTAQGMSPAKAREEALMLSLASAAVGAGTGYLGGKFGAEAGVLGTTGGTGAVARAGRAFVGEVATELPEEVAPQIVTNSLAGKHPVQGIGDTIAQTVAGVGPMATAGAASAAMTPSIEEQFARDIENAQINPDAVDAAARASMSPDNAQMRRVDATQVDAAGDSGAGADAGGGAGLAPGGAGLDAGSGGATGEAVPGSSEGASVGATQSESAPSLTPEQRYAELIALAGERGLTAEEEQETLALAGGLFPRETTGDPLQDEILALEEQAFAEEAPAAEATPDTTVLTEPAPAVAERADGTVEIQAAPEQVNEVLQKLGVSASMARTGAGTTLVGALNGVDAQTAIQLAYAVPYTLRDQINVQRNTTQLGRAGEAQPAGGRLAPVSALPVRPTAEVRLDIGTGIFMQSVWGALGKRLVFFEGDTGGNNGFILRSEADTTYLNIRGSINPMAEGIHEIVHAVRANDESAYQAFLAAVETVNPSTGQAALDTSDAALIAWANRNFPSAKPSTTVEEAVAAAQVAGRDALKEEFVADVQGYASGREGFWDAVFAELAARDKGALKKLYNAFKMVSDQIRQTLGRGAEFSGVREHIRELDVVIAAAARYLTSQPQQAAQSSDSIAASRSRVGPFASRVGANFAATQRGGSVVEDGGQFFVEVQDEQAGSTDAGGASGVQEDAGSDRRVGDARVGVRPSYGQAREHSVRVVGTHYSKGERTHLTGALYGTGLKGAEAGRLQGADPELQHRVYFYVDTGAGVKPEAGVGNVAHEVELTNIYDLSGDPLDLKSRDMNTFELAVIRAGFDGYLSRDFQPNQGAVVLLGRKHASVPVAKVGEGAQAASGQKLDEPKKSRTGEYVSRLNSMKGLPGGEVAPARWSSMILGLDPELHAELEQAGVFEGTEPVYRSELAGRYRQAGVKRSAARAATLDRENQMSITVGGKPGEFGWGATARVAAYQAIRTEEGVPAEWIDNKGRLKAKKLDALPPPPFIGPTQQTPDLVAVGEAVRKILSAKAARDVVRDATGATIQGVSQIHGSWQGKPEPSFVLTGEMSFEQANEASKLLGFVFAQDAVVAAQPWFEETDDQIQAILISGSKKMTDEQVRALHEAASAAGLDYSTTVDGKGAKFLHFGDEAGLADLMGKAAQIAKAAGLPSVGQYFVRSSLNEAATYLEGSSGTALQGARDRATAEGPSDLFRRAVDHLLVPYAKAVGAEGYRFSPERFGQRFGLTEDEVEYIRAALRPRSGRALSTVPIVTGEETIEPPRSKTNRKVAGVTKNDLLWSLQNRAAQVGFIEPGDYSPAAKKVISEAIADEVIHALNTESGKSAVGWYDAALHAAKNQYERVFPELRTDPDQEMLFDAVLGIASQGNDVHSNAVFAGRVYFLVTRKGMTLGQATKTLAGTFGKQTVAIEKNLRKLEHLLDTNGFDAMRKFFNTSATVGELNAVLRRSPELRGPDGKILKVDGAAEQMSTGWGVFGPKIGSFINNLHGDYSTLTADLWFSRTWNRYLGFVFQQSPDLQTAQFVSLYHNMLEEARTGQGRDVVGWSRDQIDLYAADPESMLTFAREIHKTREREYQDIQDEAVTPLRQAAKNLVENLTDAQETPRGDLERHFQQQTVEAAQRLVRRKTGVNITIADIQAVLWYHEKDLFKSFGVGDSKAEAADYEDAAKRFVDRFNEGDLFYVEKPKPRYVVGTKGDYLGDDVKRSTSRTQNENLARAFISLSQMEDVFQTPKSGAKELEAIVAEVMPEASIKEVTAQYSPPAGRRMWRISRGGSDAFVTMNPGLDQVWINVAGQGIGKHGNRIYSVVGNWAANNGYTFVGDPDGLSETGKRRRLENLISLKLKFPQLDARLAPSQLEWLDSTHGVKLQMREADSLHNLAEMLRASYEVNRRLHPELDHVEFTADGRFLDRRTNREFDFEGLARESHRAGAAGSVGAPGSATLRRAALAKSVVESTTAEGNSDALEALYALRDQSVPTPAGLRDVLYSRARAQTPEFKRWFGEESNLRNPDGSPMVLYHGTTRDFSAFTPSKTGVTGPGVYLGDSPEVANAYAGEDAGSNVMPVFARGRYMGLQKWSDYVQQHGWGNAREAAERDGWAGVYDERIESAVNVWDPSNIKSATGNSGAFDPADPDIRRSTSRTPPAASWVAPDFTKWDKFVYQAQDRFIDLKRVRDAIQANGAQIDERFDGYLAEELYHGRAAYRVQTFLEREVEPLMKKLKSYGIAVEDFENYLHARHAPERNAAMMKANPNQAELDQQIAEAELDLQAAEALVAQTKAAGGNTFVLEAQVAKARAKLTALNNASPYSGSEADRAMLSGMSDADAAAIVAAAEGGSKGAIYKLLGKKIDQIAAGTRATLVQYGLEKQETIDALEAAYQHYVPLRRDMEESDLLGDTAMGTGSGYSVRGSKIKRATGSLRDAEHILANLIAQREQAIVRGEKNRVVQSLYAMALAHPNPDFWVVVKPNATKKDLVAQLRSLGLDPAVIDQMEKAPTTPHINQRTGIVEHRVNVMLAREPTVVSLRVNGEDRMLILSRNDDRAVRLAKVLKNDDTMVKPGTPAADALRSLGMATRYISSVNTQYNPIFGMKNFIRDVQGAALNLSSTEIVGDEAKILGDALPALRGIWNNERGGSPDAWSQLFDEFRAEGGQTGYMDIFGGMEDRAKALQRMVEPAWWQKAKPLNYALDLLSDYNTAIENSVRLAAYKAARDKGLSKAKAASIAKNITVNFNRKGQVGREAAAGYAFLNASIQGTARIWETLKSPRGKKIIAGGIGLGVVQALVGAALMGDDWDKIPEHIRSKNLIIPLGRVKGSPETGGKSGVRYFTLPLPLGFNALPNLGRVATEALIFRDKLGSRTADLVLNTVDAVNPLGSGSFMDMALPSVLDPIYQLGKNEDAFGRPIAVEDTNGLDPRSVEQRVSRTASTPGKLIAAGINRATGGDEYTSNISAPTADQIDFIFGQLTGGVGRESLKLYQSLEGLATGDPVPANRVPILGIFYGKTNSDTGIRSRYYATVKEINEAENGLQGRAADGKDVDAWLDKHPKAALGGVARRIGSDIRKLQEYRDTLGTSAADKAEKKRVAEEILGLQVLLIEQAEAARAEAAK